MRKPALLNQQNGQHSSQIMTQNITTKPKNQKNIDLQKIRAALTQALDQNDHLRNRVSLLQAVLTQSNYQSELKNLRIRQLERQLQAFCGENRGKYGKQGEKIQKNFQVNQRISNKYSGCNCECHKTRQRRSVSN